MKSILDRDASHLCNLIGLPRNEAVTNFVAHSQPHIGRDSHESGRLSFRQESTSRHSQQTFRRPLGAAICFSEEE